MTNFKTYSEMLLNNNNELSSHCKEVSELACNFGVFLGLDLGDVKNLEKGGLIHDIGKVEIPKRILFKEGKLTNQEYELIKKHPLIGHEILSGLEYSFTNEVLPKDVLDMVLQHHERIDGNGYPYGLKDAEINPLAKIISLCDVFSAILGVRSYKKSFSIEYALSEIQKGLGTQFDIMIGEKFINFVNEQYLEHSSI